MRETAPNRVSMSIGKMGAQGSRSTNPLAHVRMVVRDSDGNENFGCSADRLSVRWLDKRPGREKARKLREMVRLIADAREIYLSSREETSPPKNASFPKGTAPENTRGTFENPFDQWLDCHGKIMRAGRGRGQEDLTSSFVSALLERAMLDAVCRLAGEPIFAMVRGDRLGFAPWRVHPELEGVAAADYTAPRPLTRFRIRHTVGNSDPLTGEDLPAERRVNDGLPETLEEYIRADGLEYFKIKLSGERRHDLRRLARIWEVISSGDSSQLAMPSLTMDANEAYGDLEEFEAFVNDLKSQQLGLFQHLLWIEQPLPRGLTLDPATEPAIRRVGRLKPLLIDEADGDLTSYKRAFKIGYLGASHKNCKGFFKSLMNRALVTRYQREGNFAFLSGEDLQNLPVVPLHQDFASLAVLGIEHCERNGHHYNYGLSMLSRKDKAGVVRHHPDMYTQRDGERGEEWFLKIRHGEVRCESLQRPGYGITQEPDWASMENLETWLARRYPG